MPSQDTVSIAAPESEVDRQLLIDGRLVTVDKTFPSINPATGEVIGYAPDAGIEEAQAAIAAAGLEEFLESKTLAIPVVPVVGGDS